MAKILVVGNSLSPLTRERGLVGQANGHQIFWFSSHRVDLPNVISLGPPKFFGRPGRYILDPLFLWITIHKVKPDLIHVHYADQGRRTPILLRYHPLVVTTMGGDILPDQLCHGFSAIRVRALLNQADCITSKSSFLDQALYRIGNYHGKIRRITWGIDLNSFRSDRNVNYLREKLNIPPDHIVFFDPRMCKPFYNKHIILNSFARYLRNSGRSAILLVAELFAETKYADGLRKRAKDLGINDKVRFLGEIEKTNMPDYYALADATISIPPSDGLPQTIYEAMACGSFMILSDLPQYRDIVEEKVTALLVPPNDEDAIGEAMVWVSRQPDLRDRVIRVGRTYVEKHANWHEQILLVNQIYDELFKRYKNRPKDRRH